MGIAADLTIVLVAALLGGLVAQYLRQPLILGYIFAGVLVGPHTGGLTVSSPRDLELLAEIGIALLLFALGLQFSFKELMPLRRVVLVGVPIQVLLTIALGVGAGRLVDWDWRASLWLGAFVASSSTTVILKTLEAQGRLGTLSGRVMLGMSVAQDLAVLPLIIVLPQLTYTELHLAPVLRALLTGGVFVAAMILVGTRVVPPLMARIARWNSRELFLLATAALGLGIGYGTYLVGLSFAFGAFVAGLVLSESEHSHQALSEIIPLRDVFSMLFFASVGMLLDPRLLMAQLGELAVLVLTLAIGKGLICSAVVRGFGYRNVVPLAAALGMFQASELAFVLARTGLASGSISEETYTLGLNLALVTMVLTPFASGLTAPLYQWLKHRRGLEPVQTMNLPTRGLAGHVVIAGAGRVGRSVGEALSRLGLPFVLIELDQRRVDQARAAGMPIVYGDAAQPTVLDAAHVRAARLMIVTTPSFTVARAIIQHTRALNPTARVVARAEGFEAIHALRELGVAEAVQPELEAALEMIRRALAQLGVPPGETLKVADEVREERYGKV